MLRLWRTFLIALFAFWFGGFMFYAGVVVPIGGEVLGSDRAQGFVTREVTVVMNFVGAAAILALWIELWRLRQVLTLRRVAIASLVLATLFQGVLFALHPWLDSQLDAQAKSILDPPVFYGRHRVYLWTITFLWLAMLVHLSVLVAPDRRRAKVAEPQVEATRS